MAVFLIGIFGKIPKTPIGQFESTFQRLTMKTLVSLESSSYILQCKGENVTIRQYTKNFMCKNLSHPVVICQLKTESICMVHQIPVQYKYNITQHYAMKKLAISYIVSVLVISMLTCK